MTTSQSWCCASPTEAFLSHFISGAEGLRTPDLRGAKADKVYSGAYRRIPWVPLVEPNTRFSTLPSVRCVPSRNVPVAVWVVLLYVPLVYSKSAVDRSQRQYGLMHQWPHFLFLERCRYTRLRETELNTLDKGKSFSRSRNRS